MKHLLVLLLVLGLATPAGAQPPITALNQGEPAPFSGMLFPNETAARWRQAYEDLESQLNHQLAACREEAAVRLRASTEELQLALDHADAREGLLTRRLEGSRRRARHLVGLWYGLGSATTALLALLIWGTAGSH